MKVTKLANHEANVLYGVQIVHTARIDGTYCHCTGSKDIVLILLLGSGISHLE